MERIGDERRSSPPTVLLAPNRTDGGEESRAIVEKLAAEAGVEVAPYIVADPDFARLFRRESVDR